MISIDIFKNLTENLEEQMWIQLRKSKKITDKGVIEKIMNFKMTLPMAGKNLEEQMWIQLWKSKKSPIKVIVKVSSEKPLKLIIQIVENSAKGLQKSAGSEIKLTAILDRKIRKHFNETSEK